MRKYLFLIVVSLLLLGCSDDNVSSNNNESNNSENVNNEDYETEELSYEEEEVVVTEQDLMLMDVVNLIDEGLAFDTGSYIKGDIPEGEYAFVTFEGSGSYYSEEDQSGSIIENENFDSFGYVYVHEAGNLKTSGVLVDVDSLETLDVKGAKELYEKLNGVEDYQDSGHYKVGVDIDPGEHVIESYGSGYIAVMDGPVGKSNIINNDNFDGRYSANVSEGNYLKLSRSYISE